MAEDEYESLPEDSPMRNHLAAGAIAGILEHTIMYPVDCIKTRLQCLRPVQEARYSGIVDGLRRIVTYEGVGRTVRGIGAVVGGAGPAHAMYFACYEYLKKFLGRQIGNNQIAYGLSGCGATVLHDAIMTPTDAIKQRIQVYNSPHANSLDCIRTVLRTDGVGVLYRAYFTQLSMNLPHHFIHFVCYEKGQDILNHDRHYHPVSHIISGGIAGGIASALTTPLDVCKTLLNTQETCFLDSKCCLAEGKQQLSKEGGRQQNIIRGLYAAAITVKQVSGWKGFWKGMQARIIFQMPGTAISWLTYESFKHYLLKPNLTSGPTNSNHHIASPITMSAVVSVPSRKVIKDT